MDYLKESEKTMALQDEGQRNVNIKTILDLYGIAEMATEIDLDKRAIFYKSSYDKLMEKQEEHTDRLEKLDALIYESVGTEKKLSQHEMNLLHAALGLFTEAGEIAEAIIESIARGTPIDNVNMLEEVGDLAWYEAIIARECGFTFEEAQKTNIAKLTKRYGDKFSTEKALERDLDGEREILEA